MILLYWFLCFICNLNELELDVNLLYVQYGYIKCILWMKCFNRGINKNMQFKGSGYKTANTNTVYTSFHKVYGMVRKVCKCTYRLPYNPLLINCHFLFIWTGQTRSIWDILYMNRLVSQGEKQPPVINWRTCVGVWWGPSGRSRSTWPPGSPADPWAHWRDWLYTGCSLNIVFFLKMFWFFWTLPVLLQCLCLTCYCVHTLKPTGRQNRPESGIYFKISKKHNI